MVDPQPISRRRAITIIASCCAFPATAIAGKERTLEWKGTALGADARIVFESRDRAKTDAMLATVRDEIERLEEIFSLYRPYSSLATLNRDGHLHRAPLELIALTRRALWYTEITHGAFDISVQALWDLYVGHFSRHPTDLLGPAGADVAATCAFVGPDHIRLNNSSICLDPGSKLTFNGIAQGYITDRVADLLRQLGWRNVLIQLGETRAIGGHPNGGPWKIGLPGEARTALFNGALATSSADGSRFVTNGPHHHLFHPASGRSATARPPVTVTASRATDADALSTALFILPDSEHANVLAKVPGAHIVPNGTQS
ncbi:MAG: FAD:protein FMN transferase [Rhodospirillales bacterium]|nr:FAD:protein FMN transferase [Rhodospirillales bacterium]